MLQIQARSTCRWILLRQNMWRRTEVQLFGALMTKARTTLVHVATSLAKAMKVMQGMNAWIITATDHFHLMHLGTHLLVPIHNS
jgi:hypothetical protein